MADKLDTKRNGSRPAGAQESQRKPRWGMVIDLDRCIGCWTCAVGCKQENNEPLGIWWNRILTIGDDSVADIDVPQGEYPNLRLAYLPINCFHCENPPCTQVCPVGATYQREDGLVVMNYDKCIGCRYCEVACPYNLRSFNWEKPRQIPESSGGDWKGEKADPNAEGFWVGAAEKPPRPRGTVEKCDFCIHRVDQGLQPFCIEVCPARARFFGDLNDPDSDVSKLILEKPTFRVREDLGTNPSLYYIPTRNPSREREPIPIDPERRELQGAATSGEGS